MAGGILCLAFSIYLLATQCDFIWDTIDALRDQTDSGTMEEMDANHSFDPTRMGYDFGNARTLTEDAHVVLFYVDDEEGQWTEDEAERFTQDTAIPGLEFMRQSAMSYGYDIELPVTPLFCFC